MASFGGLKEGRWVGGAAVECGGGARDRSSGIGLSQVFWRADETHQLVDLEETASWQLGTPQTTAPLRKR